MNTLTCNKCKLEKPADQYWPSTLARQRPTVICKQCKVETNKNWYQNNKDKSRAASRRRYAQNPQKYKIKAAQTHARQTGKAKIKRQKRRSNANCSVPQRWGHHSIPDTLCYWCGTPITGNAHLDHIMPVKLHGSAEHKNLVTSCPPCNLKKADQHPLAWIATLVS